jgi:hypothetical protein
MLLLTRMTERGGLKMSIRDHLNVWKDHPLTSAALVLIHSFPTREPEANPREA